MRGSMFFAEYMRYPHGLWGSLCAIRMASGCSPFSNPVQNYCFFRYGSVDFLHLLLLRRFFVQNLANIIVIHAKLFTKPDVNQCQRHGSGEFVESLPDEFVPEDGGGSHKGRPFFL